MRKICNAGALRASIHNTAKLSVMPMTELTSLSMQMEHSRVMEHT